MWLKENLIWFSQIWFFSKIRFISLFQWFTDKVYNKCKADKLRQQAKLLGIRQQSFDVTDDDDDIVLDWEDEIEDPGVMQQVFKNPNIYMKGT